MSTQANTLKSLEEKDLKITEDCDKLNLVKKNNFTKKDAENNGWPTDEELEELHNIISPNVSLKEATMLLEEKRKALIEYEKFESMKESFKTVVELLKKVSEDNFKIRLEHENLLIKSFNKIF